MGKPQKYYICEVCGYKSTKWLGRCPSCGAWNSFREVTTTDKKKENHREEAAVLPLVEVSNKTEIRIHTGIDELDGVLGGGIVTGSVVLIGGAPGIGKSTLLLQMSSRLAERGQKILYVSGEESITQIKLRASRLGISSDNIFVMSETDFDQIENEIKKSEVDLVILDSVQTFFIDEIGSVPGSVVQVREIAHRATQIAKSLNIPIFLVGHVTKEGNIAGPNLLEHIVDTVLYFEGDKNSDLRILRSTKNRFGPTNEVGVFQMTENGLEEVRNPSILFIEERKENVPGSAISIAMEGTRPFLVEIQALVSPSPFAVPRRTVLGIDPNRVSLLIAILEKRAQYHIGGMDIFVNVVGGLRIQETPADLAIIVAIASSFRESPIPSDTILLGEVGLVGEIRRIKDAEKRIKEAEKTGFKKAILPASATEELRKKTKMELLGVEHVREALEIIFGN